MTGPHRKTWNWYALACGLLNKLRNTFFEGRNNVLL